MDGLFAALVTVIFLIVSIAAWLWLTFRIWKTSAAGAVVTFLLGLPALYFLLKYWDDEERGIRAPFFTNFGISLAFILFAVTNPSYKIDASTDEDRAQRVAAAVKSNPEMEAWCRDKNDAVYHHVLGTCVEKDPDQEAASVDETDDVMVQLEYHFLRNGVEVRPLEIDESMQGNRRLANQPDMKRMMQFEIRSKTIMPTLVMIGECASTDACTRIAKYQAHPNAPVSVASNGNLMFFAVHLGGDRAKIELAKEVFQRFRAA